MDIAIMIEPHPALPFEKGEGLEGVLKSFIKILF